MNIIDKKTPKMKAIIWTKYGGPEGLQLQSIDKPIPKENEILIKIHATTVSAGDCEMRSLKLAMWMRPLIRLIIGVRKPKRIKILGQELAGEIEAVGKDVIQFKEGDLVMATNGFNFGGYAEYICIPDNRENAVIVKKPANMTFEEAAAIPLGGFNALHFIKQGKIQEGSKVLIIGAGGSIGTVGIQLAKYYGGEVTAIDSTEKLAMLKSIGADHVIDYTHENFTNLGKTYDVIFDIVGKNSFSKCIKSLAETGIYLFANPTLFRTIRAKRLSKKTRKRAIGGTVDYTSKDLVYLKDLVEAGKLKTVIDRTYALEDIIEAHKYVESGQKKGNVVIKIRK
ncbi:NAD-dependent alcohol dehydrogenase [Candidatus Lokiarchaeum ossiferum]|uniref:NAD-dependent alcohol dehydrogenase n=1 Tax=Candidatus Lokiarchaeum ossiferum TaxID=2951803 RepID=A0ABY6HUR4_9ARCH|nr:NAD-dependent alcohol dehydrogenase [Candidatus Lokiarchaeum sp. B-35]